MIILYISTLELNGKKYKGTLDFYVLKDIQDDLSKIGINTTIPNIFKAISEFNMDYISSFVLRSISRIDEISEQEFLENYLNQKEDEILNNFNSIFKYINDLMSKCLYRSKDINIENDIFEDEDHDINMEDWDLSNIEYTWNSILNRQENILNITPKNYFEQIEIYKKLNKINDNEVEEM